MQPSDKSIVVNSFLFLLEKKQKLETKQHNQRKADGVQTLSNQREKKTRIRLSDTLWLIFYISLAIRVRVQIKIK